MSEKDNERAKSQARAQINSIVEMIENLETAEQEKDEFKQTLLELSKRLERLENKDS